MMTQKSKSHFSCLSPEDRKYVLKLCSEKEYTEVAEILAKPRSEGGLDLYTSRAALCRFFTQYQADPTHGLLAQLAAAANIRHEQDANAFLGAIRATVQARVLKDLRDGKSLADMSHDFRLLKTAENLYLSDAKFRAEHPKSTRANYQKLVQTCANLPSADFVPLDEDLPDDGDHPHPLDDVSDFQIDVSNERSRQQKLRAQLKTAGLDRDDLPCNPSDLNPTTISILSNLKRSTTSTETPESEPSIPPKDAHQTPVIPAIPPNSTSRVSPIHAFSREQTPPAETKPKPHLAPSKPGRNAPCPCGSGRKSKKCCHR